MNYLIVLLVLSAVTYRVSRFIVHDSLIDAPRNKIYDWLEHREHPFWLKIHELIGCPWCITIWIAAGAVAVHHVVVEDVPVPIWTWLAVATGSLIIWEIIDDG